MWKYKGENLVNQGPGNKLISVKDNKDAEAQPVHVVSGNGSSASQRWRIVYADKMTGSDAYRKKGQMSKESGIIVDEPFYFRSRLPMQRVVECVGANNAVIKKWAKGRKAQQWRFDAVSKTIRGMYWTSYVLSQEGANLRCRTMNSRWF
jgi:hypothetical protein